MKLFEFVKSTSNYFWQEVEQTLSEDSPAFINTIPEFISKISRIINTPNFVNITKKVISEKYPESTSLSMENIKNIPSMKCILYMDKWIDNITDIELRKKTMRWWRKVGIRNPNRWHSITSDSKHSLKPFPQYVIDYINTKCKSDFQYSLLEQILKVEEDILSETDWKNIFRLRYESFFYSTVWLIYEERVNIFGTDSVDELIKYLELIPLSAYIGTLLDDAFDYEEDIAKGQKTLFTVTPFKFNTTEWSCFILKIMNTLEPLLNFDKESLPPKYIEWISKAESEIKDMYALYPHQYRNTKSLAGTILYTGIYLLISNITNKENLKNDYIVDIKDVFKDISL